MKGYITKLYYLFEKGFKKLLFLINMVQLRHLAHKDRKRVIKRKGKSVVNREVKKTIKEYARERFGSKAYWPYLAYYTEMRGEFVKQLYTKLSIACSFRVHISCCKPPAKSVSCSVKMIFIACVLIYIYKFRCNIYTHRMNVRI